MATGLVTNWREDAERAASQCNDPESHHDEFARYAGRKNLMDTAVSGDLIMFDASGY
jgi:hypothetical protein